MRKEITEEQITNLMQAIPRAEEVDRLLAEVERLRWALEVEGLRLAACDVVAMADTPESADRARQMQSGLRSAALSSVERRVDEVIALRAENERLRGALTDMLSGWRYIRETYGDLTGIGWDRAEQKARNALGGKP